MEEADENKNRLIQLGGPGTLELTDLTAARRAVKRLTEDGDLSLALLSLKHSRVFSECPQVSSCAISSYL